MNLFVNHSKIELEPTGLKHIPEIKRKTLRYSVESKMKGFCEGAMPGEDYVEV